MQRYDLLLTGKTLPGRDRKAAVAALAKVMQLPEAGAQALLKGREQLILRNLDDLLLARYVAALQAAGVAMRVAPVAAVDASVADPAQRETRIRELEALTRELNATQPYEQDPVTCACCGSRHLRRRASAKPCPNCGWQDDPRQRSDPDRVLPGINRGLNLKQAREEYAAYGSLDPQRYRPNGYSLRQRVTGGVLALCIVAYCGWSLWTGRMYLWAYSRNTHRAFSGELQGVEVWLMSGALLAGASLCLLLIADHYDRRRNELGYRKAGQVAYLLMMVLLGLALTLQAWRSDGLGFALIIAALMAVFVTLTVVHRKKFSLDAAVPGGEKNLNHGRLP